MLDWITWAWESCRRLLDSAHHNPLESREESSGPEGGWVFLVAFLALPCLRLGAISLQRGLARHYKVVSAVLSKDTLILILNCPGILRRLNIVY